MTLPLLTLAQVSRQQMGDSQSAQAVVVPRCFGSLSEQAMAQTSAICPLRLLDKPLSTMPIALEVIDFQDSIIH